MATELIDTIHTYRGFWAVFEGRQDEGVAFVLDLTERKRAEAALHQGQLELAHVTRIAMPGELTASIAHEINRPLAAIVTNGNACVRLLAGNPLNLAEAREAVEAMIHDGYLAPGAVVVRAPVAKRMALAARAWQRTLMPSERMDGGVALCSGAEVVHMRAHRQGCASPDVTKPVRPWVGDAHLFLTFCHSYKPREIARLVLVLTCRVLTLGGTACTPKLVGPTPGAGYQFAREVADTIIWMGLGLSGGGTPILPATALTVRMQDAQGHSVGGSEPGAPPKRVATCHGACGDPVRQRRPRGAGAGEEPRARSVSPGSLRLERLTTRCTPPARWRQAPTAPRRT